MPQYIDKNAVVVEIERIIEEPAPSHDSQCSWEDGYYCGLCKAESIIDTLEVKEVDLENAARHYLLHEHLSPLNNILHQADLKTEMQYHKDIETAFKNGFELGLKAQQNNSINVTDIDKIIEENGVDPNSKEAKMFKESYYIALEKLKAQKGE